MFKLISSLFFVALPVLFLSACSMTVPVKGQFASGSQSFSGTATGYIGGTGNLKVTSTDGITCTGDFVYVTSRKGEGTFVCSDGRSGPFQFVSNGSSGTGTGQIGNEMVTFTFGK